MTDLSRIPPLGRSAEEIEAEDANRVNPPATRTHDDGPSLVPHVPVANTGVTVTGNVDTLGSTRAETEAPATLATEAWNRRAGEDDTQENP
ncbi:hypothetical protein [Deinococcus pimensis]|uniref:hypothetical protein n=1 Tax=Deinococcus pimensis TaxID=309888 RepID=UPI00048A3CCC|nr:hypothetical protein [Deinococcus pimensis]